MQQMRPKNRLQLLPIELQLLIYEFSGEHRTKMKQLLQHLIQRDYKCSIVKEISKKNYYKTRCQFCGKSKIIFAEIYYHLHPFDYAFICSNSCDKKLRELYPYIYYLYGIYRN